MDLRPTIERLGRDYTVTRRGAVSRVDGRVVEGTSSELTVRAVITPASGGDARRLPEGARVDDFISIRATTQLRAVNVADQTPADLIAYGGQTWEVVTTDAWDPHGNYCAALAQRRGQ